VGAARNRETARRRARAAQAFFGLRWQEAQEGLGRLQRDKGFVSRALNGDSDAMRRFTQFHAVAYPGQ
jgi:hypothetical protein